MECKTYNTPLETYKAANCKVYVEMKDVKK